MAPAGGIRAPPGTCSSLNIPFNGPQDGRLRIGIILQFSQISFLHVWGIWFILLLPIFQFQWDGCIGKWEYKSPAQFEENGKDTSSDESEDDAFFTGRSARLRKKKKMKRHRQASFCDAIPKRGLFD